MENNLAKTLGLAFISKNLVVGQDNINKLNYNKIKVIIYANDLSEKYLRFLKNTTEDKEIVFKEVEVDLLPTALGIKNAKICAVTNKAFSRKIIELIKE